MNSIYQEIRKVIFTALVTLPLVSFSQKSGTDRSLVFECGLGGRFYAPLKVEPVGENVLKTHTTPVPMVFLAVNSSPVFKGLSFRGRFEVSSHGYWFSYDVKVPQDNPLYQSHQSVQSFRDISLFPMTSSFGIEVFKSVNLENQGKVFFGLGVNAGFVPSHSQSSSGTYNYVYNGDTLSQVVFNQRTSLKESTVFINLAASAAYAFKVGKRYHKINFGVNISQDRIGEGSYAFYLSPKVSYGSIYTRNLYSTMSYSVLLSKE